ncbi:hypothetical protein [Citromicrobium bathyomarinum]|uniref:hypothetical protein n=1 Tax=Citromicrobium bathyomarinum TaxID=72174 RepID=UPI00315ACB9B
MKRVLCTISCALILCGCGDKSADDKGELATAKAEAAAAKAETAAMKAEMAASGGANGTATPAPSPTKSTTAPKADSKAKGNGKYRMPTADELANGVNANCDVTLEGYSYSGPCKFNAKGGASFGISRADGYPMNQQFEEIYLEADTRTAAYGRFRDSDGNWQDIGIMTRPNTKDACWTGDMTKVCAYGKKF